MKVGAYLKTNGLNNPYEMFGSPSGWHGEPSPKLNDTLESLLRPLLQRRNPFVGQWRGGLPGAPISGRQPGICVWSLKARRLSFGSYEFASCRKYAVRAPLT